MKLEYRWVAFAVQQNYGVEKMRNGNKNRSGPRLAEEKRIKINEWFHDDRRLEKTTSEITRSISRRLGVFLQMTARDLIWRGKEKENRRTTLTFAFRVYVWVDQCTDLQSWGPMVITSHYSKSVRSFRLYNAGTLKPHVFLSFTHCWARFYTTLRRWRKMKSRWNLGAEKWRKLVVEKMSADGPVPGRCTRWCIRGEPKRQRRLTNWPKPGNPGTHGKTRSSVADMPKLISQIAAGPKTNLSRPLPLWSDDLLSFPKYTRRQRKHPKM